MGILPLRIAGDLLYWCHVANTRGRYTRGSSETILDSDLRILFQGGRPTDLLGPLEAQIGRRTVAPADLIGRGVNNPLFLTMYLALKGTRSPRLADGPSNLSWP
jgi:hypothetical protein